MRFDLYPMETSPVVPFPVRGKFLADQIERARRRPYLDNAIASAVRSRAGSLSIKQVARSRAIADLDAFERALWGALGADDVGGAA
jgi:hypothetical protein